MEETECKQKMQRIEEVSTPPGASSLARRCGLSTAADQRPTSTNKRPRKLTPPEADLWCNPEFVVGFGSPADGVLKVPTDGQADLIVLGVRRSTNFPGHLPPATAYKVVRQAQCPVLAVRR